jgi:hypothetical protein
VRTVHARAATAAVLLFLYAALWLVLLGLAGWVGVPRSVLLVLAATQAGWVVGVGLLAGWRWARFAAILYAVFGFALGVWSAWFGMTANYGTTDWIFTGIIGFVPVLIGGLALKPTR